MIMIKKIAFLLTRGWMDPAAVFILSGFFGVFCGKG